MARVGFPDRFAGILGIVGIILAIPGVIQLAQTGAVQLWALGAIVASILLLFGALLRERSMIDRMARSVWGDRVEDIRRCSKEEVQNAWKIAQNKLGGRLTSPKKALEIQEVYPDAIKVAICEGRYGMRVLRGYFMAFPITKSSVESIRNASFDITELSKEDVVADPAKAEAIYVGGIAAIGFRAWHCLLGAMHGSADMARSTASQTAYARAATELGKRSLIKYGFKPVNPNAREVGNFYKKVYDE